MDCYQYLPKTTTCLSLVKMYSNLLEDFHSLLIVINSKYICHQHQTKSVDVIVGAASINSTSAFWSCFWHSFEVRLGSIITPRYLSSLDNCFTSPLSFSTSSLLLLIYRTAINLDAFFHSFFDILTKMFRVCREYSLTILLYMSWARMKK